MKNMDKPENMLDWIGAEQTAEGLFPTYRAKKGADIIEDSASRIDNIWLHTIILEILVRLFPQDNKMKIMFARGLEWVIHDSVDEEGRKVWRWLKDAKERMWHYPADADDTARGRMAIELAMQQGVVIPQDFEEFDFKGFIENGMTSEGGRLTFGGLKPDDTICPVVNASLLRSYGVHLRRHGENKKKDITYQRIKAYLEKVVRDPCFDGEDFSQCSKFYLSPRFFCYALTLLNNDFDENTLEHIQRRLERFQGVYDNAFEAAVATAGLIRLRGDKKTIRAGIRQILDLKRSDDTWDAAPIYQHQRSSSVFGSSLGTTMFCLDVLEKYRQPS